MINVLLSISISRLPSSSASARSTTQTRIREHGTCDGVSGWARQNNFQDRHQSLIYKSVYHLQGLQRVVILTDVSTVPMRVSTLYIAVHTHHPPRSMIGCYAQCRRLKKHSFIGHIALRTTPRESTSCCCLLDFSSWRHAPQTTPHTRPPPHPEIRPSVDQVFFRAGERASFLVLPSPAASPVQAYHQPTS